MVNLLDANILLALAWPAHTQHSAARAWFYQNHKSGWATCSFTEAAFVRISSNPRVFGLTYPVSEALQALRHLRRLPEHRFLSDDVSPASSVFMANAVHHNQTTDAHLLTLAHENGLKLVTFDRGIERLIPSDKDRKALLEVLIP